MKKLNLNSTIKFRLNDRGMDIYYHHTDELNRWLVRRGCKPLDQHFPKVDKDGFSSFQLWEFMSIFGEHSGMGRPDYWQDLNIYIKDADLDDVPDSNPSLGDLI